MIRAVLKQPGRTIWESHRGWAYGPKHDRGHWEDFPYMARLPIDGKPSQYIGRLPICGKTFPFMGRLHTCGKISILCEDFPSVGRLPIYGESARIQDFTRMGSLRMYGKSSDIWEVFPYMETKSCMVTNMFGDQQRVIQRLWRCGTWPREMADGWHTGGRPGPAGVYPP